MNNTNVRVPIGFESFGPWFNETVEIIKAQWQAWALIALVYMAIQGAGFVLGRIAAPLAGLVGIAAYVLLYPGLIKAGLKSVRGQTPEINDLFSAPGFVVGAFIILIAQGIGFIGCCIGVFVTTTLFCLAMPLLVDKGMSFGDALKASYEATKQNFWFYLVYMFVLGIVSGLGFIACIIGVLVTMPLAIIGMCIAYERTFNGPAVAAGPDTAPQAPPPAAPEAPEPPAPPAE